jgi:hypothetical protein
LSQAAGALVTALLALLALLLLYWLYWLRGCRLLALLMDRARLITLVPSALFALLEFDYQFLELAV